MGKDSNISWTNHTFNPHWGCEKPLVEIGGKTVVSPECVNCYAESLDKRTGEANWGKAAPRRFFSTKHWNEPLHWNKEAEKCGERKRVFCASMGDILEDRLDLNPVRTRLWPLIVQTPWLDWLLLTKRHDKLESLVPFWAWELPNVWAGVSAGTQEMAELRIPFLTRMKEMHPLLVTFVSVEPLIGPVDIQKAAGLMVKFSMGIDWVIVGGESGAKARPMRLEWARLLRDQCAYAGVSFFMKQLSGRTAAEREAIPKDLMVRQFPNARQRLS